MSYESMAREDTCCDFPGCPKDFCNQEDLRNAIETDGVIKAFCLEHTLLLVSEGVLLRPLSAIHREKRQAKEAAAREADEKFRKARDAEFIRGLKK